MSGKGRADRPGLTVAMFAPSPENDPYGSLRLATACYGDGFRALGCKVVTIERSRIDREAVLKLQSPEIDVVFSDGGWVHTVDIETSDGKKTLAATLNKPIIQLLCDNPCAHWLSRTTSVDYPSQTTAVLDPDFLTLWSRWTPASGPRLTYVPACPPVDPAEDAERDIDFLVVASIQKPEKYRDFVIDNCRQTEASAIFDGIVDLGMSDPLRPFSAVCDQVFHELNVKIYFHNVGARVIIYLADQFIRARRRRDMLERLAAFPITLVGGGEDIRLHPAARVIPPVDHGKLLDLYRRSRKVVVSPPYAGGISERMTHAMAAGALVVSPPTVLSDRLMGRDRLFATTAADFSDLAQTLERVADTRSGRNMAQTARAYALRVFSPATTVEGLLAGKLDYPCFEERL
jgi:hypothetical protein